MTGMRRTGPAELRRVKFIKTLAYFPSLGIYLFTYQIRIIFQILALKSTAFPFFQHQIFGKMKFHESPTSFKGLKVGSMKGTATGEEAKL